MLTALAAVSVVSTAATVPPGAQTSDVIEELLNAPAPEPGWQAAAEFLDDARVQVSSTGGVILANEGPFVAPPDDATTEVLVGFWTARARRRDRNVEPSDATRERLLATSEEDPSQLALLLNFLPDTQAAHDRVKALWDREARDGLLNDGWRDEVRSWLMFRSAYFRDELVAAARNVRYEDRQVRGEEELKALARLDWESAAPLLRAYEIGDQPRTAALATAIGYSHAIEAETGDVEVYRTRLRAIVEDQNATGTARDTAFRALMDTVWEGRDDWYLSLFADATLLEIHDGFYLVSPLTFPVSRDPDHWIPIVADRVGDANPAVHDTAVSCLVQFHLGRAREDALRPLLPWLMDEDWSSARDRLRLIQSMDLLDMPESVPGLIQIVGNEDDAAQRSYAAESLTKYADPRAVGALRRGLQKEPEEDHRKRIIEGLVASGGVLDSEAADAIEAVATEMSTPEGRERLSSSFYSFGREPLPLPVSIGLHLSRMRAPSVGTVAAALARARELESARPEIAEEMLEIIHAAWASDAVDRDIVQWIRDFTASASSIRSALSRRTTVRENVEGELRELVEFGGTRGGIASVLLDDRAAELSFLSRADTDAQRALLACARLVREPLPVDEIGRLLASDNAQLVGAAMRYLESEDSVEARRLVLASQPDQALIIGARQGVDPGHNSYSYFDEVEAELRERVLADAHPEEIVAMLRASYWGGNDHMFIRTWTDRVELTYVEDEARYYERSMDASEWEALDAFLSDRNVDELPPYVASIFDGGQVEYVRLRRSGGRRVFMNNPETDSIYGLLVERLYGLLRASDLSVHYRFGRAIDGLERLIGPPRPVEAVWSENGRIIVLVSNEHGNPSEWRTWEGAELGPVVAEPNGMQLVESRNDIPEGMDAARNAWQVSSGPYRIRAGRWRETVGLWKCREGQDPILIREGNYGSPVVTPDGKWAIAAKTETHWADPNQVVRIRMDDGREYPVEVEAASTFAPKVYVDAHRKVLLTRNEEEDSETEFFLLDPESGEVASAEGEFEPLLQQTVRSLQTAGQPHLFWATQVDHRAVRTVLGRYDARSFVFEGVMELPDIRFSGVDVFVEEEANRVWLVYRGDLLRFPLAESPSFAPPGAAESFE